MPHCQLCTTSIHPLSFSTNPIVLPNWNVLCLLDEFDVVGGEHAVLPVRRHSGPPPLVDHVDVGDDVVRIKRNLCVVSCKVEIKRVNVI